MELCLGTVQFGMDYGIRNQKCPQLEDAIRCLDYATQNGISCIDTANAYGRAEDVVGEFLKKGTVSRGKLCIISKLKPNVLDLIRLEDYYGVVKSNVEKSLSRLGIDYLDVYLLHTPSYVFDDRIVDSLNQIKKDGYAKKVGVSIYEVEEAKQCLNNSKIEFIQLPYSIFDQRMKRQGVFEEAQRLSNIQIHSRSAFIQGLVLMKESEVPEYLQKAKPIIRRINEICSDNNLSPVSLAMNYVRMENSISHLVFGVDNIDQLKEDIRFFNSDIDRNLVMDISEEFNCLDADIVMPSLWKK